MDYSDRDYLVELGRNIAAKRKELHLTQADLAGHVNMEVPNLSVIETGKSNPQVLTLVRICAALGCNLSELLPHLDDPMAFLNKAPVYTPRRHPSSEERKPAQPKPYPLQRSNRRKS
jgi:transcriptional regulator with XRE-family HTH domain